MKDYPEERKKFIQRATNITAVEHRVSPEMRFEANGHRGAVFWLTGLSGPLQSRLSGLFLPRGIRFSLSTAIICGTG